MKLTWPYVHTRIHVFLAMFQSIDRLHCMNWISTFQHTLLQIIFHGTFSCKVKMRFHVKMAHCAKVKLSQGVFTVTLGQKRPSKAPNMQIFNSLFLQKINLSKSHLRCQASNWQAWNYLNSIRSTNEIVKYLDTISKLDNV